jgi:hypothetical protein
MQEVWKETGKTELLAGRFELHFIVCFYNCEIRCVLMVLCSDL